MEKTQEMRAEMLRLAICGATEFVTHLHCAVIEVHAAARCGMVAEMLHGHSGEWVMPQLVETIESYKKEAQDKLDGLQRQLTALSGKVVE